jgi:hypothetical protein
VVEAEVELDEPAPEAGASSPWDGSSKAPIPHWMTSPLVAVSVPVGVTVVPLASAIVKRVVNKTLAEAGDENL